MKKAIIADFMEFDDPCNKLGNYHYARCFANDGYEVLWMSCLYNKLMYFKNKEVYKDREKLSSVERHRLIDNIYGFSVKSNRLYGKYPFCKSASIVLENEKYISKGVKEDFKKIGFLDVDVLWISNPKQFWLTNVINYKKLVFRIPDDFEEFGVFPKSIGEIEKALIEKADVVFVTAENLKGKPEKYGKQAFLLPNGCELEHFFKDRKELPFEYLNDSKKKIIYVGAIGEWFNVELMEKVSKEVDASIYIIGKEQKDLSPLKKYPNVKILGPKPYEVVPQYIKNADAAIIPFINNKFTDRINPIKLFEYLACGVPVVTTNMKEVVNLNSPAFVSKSDDEFIKNLKQIIISKDFDKKACIEFAKSNSWDARFQQIKKIIKEE